MYNYFLLFIRIGGLRFEVELEKSGLSIFSSKLQTGSLALLDTNSVASKHYPNKLWAQKARNGDTLGPVELIVWPEQVNQGDWRGQDGQGEVSIIIFGMRKSSGFQKYSISWVFRHFVCVFVFVVVFVIVFVFVLFIVNFLVMSCLLITLNKCLKGHKSLGWLFNVEK